MPETQQQAAKLTARGITSRRDITVIVERRPAGYGIVFELAVAGTDGTVRVPARTDFIMNTLRNVTVGIKTSRLCIVEHFLCAASLWGLDDLHVRVDGPEMPLGDGSARFWIDLFKDAGWDRIVVPCDRELAQPVICKKGDRAVMAIPDDSFSATYLMDWNHPAIGRCWGSWTAREAIEAVSDARTFGTMEEHRVLGISDQDVVSLTADGFSQPLRFADEPVRHKILDLIGDLALVGVNPLSWKARFISVKGGHELDVELARAITARQA